VTTAILAALAPFIAAIAPVLAQWVLRRWAAQADPQNKLAEQKHENAKAVADGDPVVINRLLDERINRVRPNPKQDADPASR
jgi:hypothetical protein